MKNKLLFLALIFLCQTAFAKTNKLILVDEVVSISLDSINPVISSWGDYIVQVNQSNGESKIVFRADASANDLGKLKEIDLKKEIVYVLPIYELLAGYDYLFVIQLNPLRCFITKPFNYNEGRYMICDEISLNRKPYYLTIKENGKVRKIYLSIYRAAYMK